MAKNMRALFYGLIALVAILAFSTTFFYAKSRSSSSQKATTSTSTATPQASTSTPQATSSSTVTKATSTSERPSHPTDTYTINKNETLLSIAKKQGTTLTELAEANGITDTDNVQAGKVLAIPKSGQINYTVDNDKAASLQKSADSGKIQWRLSPEDTARADSPSIYGLQVGDTFTLKENDKNSGKGKVLAESNGKTYLIILVQPQTKGDKGIWAIESISPS